MLLFFCKLLWRNCVDVQRKLLTQKQNDYSNFLMQYESMRLLIPQPVQPTSQGVLPPQFVSERSQINITSPATGKYAGFLILSDFVVFLRNNKLFRQ
jgi:hypothetical protein